MWYMPDAADVAGFAPLLRVTRSTRDSIRSLGVPVPSNLLQSLNLELQWLFQLIAAIYNQTLTKYIAMFRNSI